MITITPRDAKRTENVKPGWQICECVNHFTKPASTDGSTVHNYEIDIVEGEFAGTPLKNLTISEKALSMGKNFFLACGLPKEEWDRALKGESISFDEKNPVGKRFKAMVSNTKFENRIQNEATDFLPLSPGVAAASV